MIHIIFMKECKKMFNIKKYDYVPNIYDLIDFPPNESNENHTMDDLYFSSLRKSDKELYDFVKDFQIKYPKYDLYNKILLFFHRHYFSTSAWSQ